LLEGKKEKQPFLKREGPAENRVPFIFKRAGPSHEEVAREKGGPNQKNENTMDDLYCLKLSPIVFGGEEGSRRGRESRSSLSEAPDLHCARRGGKEARSMPENGRKERRCGGVGQMRSARRQGKKKENLPVCRHARETKRGGWLQERQDGRRSIHIWGGYESRRDAEPSFLWGGRR